jgi:hypothetical protein
VSTPGRQPLAEATTTRWRYGPDGQLRNFLAGVEVTTGFGFGLGGWSASLDTGLLAFLPAPVKRLIGRLLRRRRRRDAATGPPGQG